MFWCKDEDLSRDCNQRGENRVLGKTLWSEKPSDDYSVQSYEP